MAYRSSQTLIEGIIAISVITVGLMGVIGLAIGNSTSAAANSDRSQATALAREGLEVAKHVRDSNWLAGVPFSTNLLTADTAVPQSRFDTGSPSLSLNFGAYGDFLSSDTVVSWLDTPGQERFVQLQPGEATKFRRVLTFHALCRATSHRGTDFAYRLGEHTACALGTEDLIGVQVVSDVQWRQGLGTKHVKLELRLFDWR